MNSLHVLISLYKGYGLGDAVQVSAILRHVIKARPQWRIDFQAEPGREKVGRGIAHNIFTYGQPYPTSHYDAEVQIVLYDTWANWGDRPNTRVSSCLHEVFNLPWDEECGRYQINVTETAIGQARQLAAIYLNGGNRRVRSSCVAVHYQGDSSQDKKNLSNEQAVEICEEIKRLGRCPLLLDYKGRSSLTQFHRASNPEWGRDAEMQCAVISQCEAFIGIDSGPGKCASATNTPTLITWTGHHPAPFHDPADNTHHLVPTDYHNLFPVCSDANVIQWFEKHYNTRQYRDDPVSEIKMWLSEVLQ